MNNTDKLEEILLAFAPDILVITETWLLSSIHDSEIIPEGYSLLCKDCDSRGGGVAIAIKDGLTFQEEHGIPNHEGLWRTVTFQSTPLLIGGVYRRPEAPEPYLTEFHNYLLEKLHDRTKLVLVGDFSLAGIAWDNLTVSNREANSCKQLLDTMLSFSLSQCVTQATRIQGLDSNILDLALISSSINAQFMVEDGISDHKLVLFQFPNLSLAKSDNKTSHIFIIDYSRAADESIIDYLEMKLDDF